MRLRRNFPLKAAYFCSLPKPCRQLIFEGSRSQTSRQSCPRPQEDPSIIFPTLLTNDAWICLGPMSEKPDLGWWSGSRVQCLFSKREALSSMKSHYCQKKKKKQTNKQQQKKTQNSVCNGKCFQLLKCLVKQ
jgi:hypothetical protein